MLDSKAHETGHLHKPAAVIKGVANILVHAPDLVRHGSKPSREIRRGGETLLKEMTPALRNFEEAIAYPPNQVFIGNLFPGSLNAVEQPWYKNPVTHPSKSGPYGEIVEEDAFYGAMKICDEFGLLVLEHSFTSATKTKLRQSSLWTEQDLSRLCDGATLQEITKKVACGIGLPIYFNSQVIGCIQRAHEQDEALSAQVILENLACKASGVLALRRLLLNGSVVPPEGINYIFSFSEEAVGDRYNRGGGNMAKAIGEMAGCINATGSDIKDFCSAPVHALIVAASMVASGTFKDIAVVGGGSLPKLGMKFLSHLGKKMPIIEDVLGAVAFLVGEDDRHSPVVRTDIIGKHDIGCGSSQQAIMEAIIVRPLEKAGRKITEVDKYATELHNPEITVPADRGDVPKTNYRLIGALAVKRGEIKREDLEHFVEVHGMPGFAPTQGHIGSAIPFLACASDMIKSGEIKTAMFLAKGSLFLGRMTNLSDGISVLIEKNPGRAKPG